MSDPKSRTDGDNPDLKEVGKPAHKTHESRVDDSVEMSFPASDPPAIGGTTKLREKPAANKSK